jgi:hypothetical protein
MANQARAPFGAVRVYFDPSQLRLRSGRFVMQHPRLKSMLEASVGRRR